jgi:hypothetical protein
MANIILASVLLVASIVNFGPMQQPLASDNPDVTAAAKYCSSTGGVVQLRTPVYGTNASNTKTWLYLSGSQPFCAYTAKDKSSIYVLLTTLYTTKPTLAALAYFSKVKPNCSGGGNPASCYCSQLGGTDLFGGITAAGGGWVLAHSTTDILDTCIMPDLSSIDSFGLFYHSAGIIRGRDLSKVLRYHKP